MGTGAIIYTAAYILVFAFFAGRTILAFASGAQPDTFDLVVSILLLALIIAGWVRSVRAYQVTDSHIILRRAGPGSVQVPLDTLDKVDANPRLGSFFNATFMSIGGLFGWAGQVRVSKPGDSRSVDAQAYGTNPSRSVLLQLKSGHTLIVTPADPVAFADAVRQASANSKAIEARNTSSVGSRGKSKRARR
jgi:hypothetical protein